MQYCLELKHESEHSFTFLSLSIRALREILSSITGKESTENDRLSRLGASSTTMPWQQFPDQEGGSWAAFTVTGNANF